MYTFILYYQHVNIFMVQNQNIFIRMIKKIIK